MRETFVAWLNNTGGGGGGGGGWGGGGGRISLPTKFNEKLKNRVECTNTISWDSGEPLVSFCQLYTMSYQKKKNISEDI